MKTIKFTVKNSNGSKNANFNFPDLYEKIFDKYEMEAYEFHDLFGKLMMNLYFRNKQTNLDDATFLVKNCQSNELFVSEIQNIMNKMLNKMESKDE